MPKLIHCERKKDSYGRFGMESIKAAKGSSKGITTGKAVVQLRKQENNCFRLQYNSVVTSELFFEWDKMMTNLILTCTVCILPTR